MSSNSPATADNGVNSPTHGTVPKWLEDMSDNVQKNRPGSWKLNLSHASTPNIEHQLQIDQSSPHRSKIDLDCTSVDGSVLDLRRVSCGTDDMFRLREGSATHGRRAVSENDTRSIGSSPRKTLLSDDDLNVSNPLLLSPLRERLRASQEVNDPEKGRAISGRSRRRREAAENDLSLEESWSSLNFFNKKQKGRITTDVEATPDKVATSPSPDVPPNSEVSGLGDFIIPELPAGMDMVINIRSTWGDRHYLGLNGIELYSSTGEPVAVQQISAKPSDINELPEYGKDPRVVSNLLDGVNRTHDDMHLWLAPFTENADHLVSITFTETCRIAMIRIWNYNKSRIHSYRGVREIDISLDGVLIFRGEIARACGGIQGGTEAFGDTILFTTDDAILELISQHDESFNSSLSIPKDEREVERPATGDRCDTRPFTGVMTNSISRRSSDDMTLDLLLSGQKLEICLTANWGHPFCIGLTGLEVFGSSGTALPIKPCYLSCSSPGAPLSPLVDGVNLTTDERHMWQTNYTAGQQLLIAVEFPEPVLVAGVRMWNYNSSQDMAYSGVRLATLCLDDRPISPGAVTLRRAPGNCHFNYAQDLHLSSPPPAAPQPPSCPGRDDDAPMPHGFVFQLMILSTWGDAYYVGLNGLELYDGDGEKIELTENNIGAFPDSVNVLEGVNDDVRTPDKLVDGVNETADGRHMWLAPILPSQLNRIYVIFDSPVTVSMVKLWNYSKTPARGIKEFGILVDDLLVYNGVLDRSSASTRDVPYRTVLFTNDEKLPTRERSLVTRDVNYGDSVELLNNHHRVTSGGSHLSADQSQRPLTSIPSARARIKSLDV